MRLPTIIIAAAFNRSSTSQNHGLHSSSTSIDHHFNLTENNKNTLRISHEDIKLATQYFIHEIGNGEYWCLYKGELKNNSGQRSPIVAKWLNERFNLDHEFNTELNILYDYKHENIVCLVGYCNDSSEQIIVYGPSSNGILKRHLKDINLTWMNRVKICIDVVRGLDFLHRGSATQEPVIHRDLNSSGILLSDDWKARIANLGHSLKTSIDGEFGFEIDDSHNVFYIDPVFHDKGTLTKESDIYSLGLLLFEILCGELVVDNSDNGFPSKLVKHLYDKERIDEMVFHGIKEKIVPESLTTFQTIAYQCLHDRREDRPTTSEVLAQLKEALEFQEEYEIWAPKLPIDYKEIISMSKTPMMHSTKKKKDLYHMFSKGILIRNNNSWFSLGSNAERTEIVSSRKFSYKNLRLHKWLSLPNSRFPKVAEMLDISNMNIQIRIKTQFLFPDVNYRVHLIFKFCGPRKSLAKRMYVNLSYKKGNENLHTYFATWREDGWMMVELCSFLNPREETYFNVLLKSFSRCYCESGTIYVEGIQFQAINNVESQGTNNSNVRQDFTTNTFIDKLKLKFWLRKKNHMISAIEALHDSSNVKLFKSKPLKESRFQEVIELGSQQVFRINCKIGSQVLSPNTEYECYLVFKLSESCRGLHCPVIVRDILHWKKKETEILYFRSPTPLNRHDLNMVPQDRGDGWMEVNVWKFNSTQNLRMDRIPINLKLITFEGTMSGLVIFGLEFRPL